MNTKSLGRFEVKDADKGQVSAVFAEFDIVDLDNDVTKAGAFEDGADVVISAYGHQSWAGALPVGKGVIRQTKSAAILDGQFFMDTQAGRDTFTVVKELGAKQAWSYGYDATQFSYGEFDGKQVRFLEKLKTHEVSPVLLGAGPTTRTLSAKGQKMTFREEAEAVLAACDALADRAADVMAMRQEKGKGLSDESAGLLEQVGVSMKRLTELLTVAPGSDEGADALQREFMRFAQLQHAIG